MTGGRIIIAISASRQVASNADPRGRAASQANPSVQFLLLGFRIASECTCEQRRVPER